MQGSTPQPSWSSGHRVHVVGTDAVTLIVAALLAQFLAIDVEFSVDFGWPAEGVAWLFAALLVVSWLVVLAAEGVWDTWALGNRSAEVRRILLASMVVFATVGIAGYLTEADLARSYLLIAVPVGTAGLLVGHWLWRRRLAAFRRSGSHRHGVVVVGDLATAGALCASLRDRLGSGFEVNGVCILRAPAGEADGSPTSEPELIEGFRVLGGVGDVVAATTESGSDWVAVAASPWLDQDRLPALVCSLDGTGVRLLVEPGMSKTATRSRIRPIAGLPLLLLPESRLSGTRATAKTGLDLFVALVGIIVLSPLMLVAAVTILLADGGPILYQHDYVGRSGKVFKSWAFRCTPYGAKPRPATNDPSRVARPAEFDLATTRVGRLLRRIGLDEAPRLFNVLTLQMSVVGPKPLSPGNIAPYPLPVRPGITGPWRLAGPSDDFAEADFRYTENWSVTGDLKIIGRSLKLAVTGGSPR